MRSWILSVTISVWPDAAMTIGKASVPSGEASSTVQREIDHEPNTANRRRDRRRHDGAGIAEVAAAAGHPVLLYDIASEALTRAVEGIRQRLAARVARGKLTADQADALVSRLVPVTELAALADAGW